MQIGMSVKNGIIYAFCDSHCLKQFKASNRPPWNPGEVINADPRQLEWPHSCLYCRWCGLLVYEPPDCAAHEVLDCPGYSWEHSNQAHLFVVHFLLRTGRRRVPDFLMDQAEELALMHPDMGGSEMADAIIDRL